MSDIEELEMFCLGVYNTQKTDLEVLLMAQAKIAKMIYAELAQ